jgi:hypothetical protein
MGKKIYYGSLDYMNSDDTRSQRHEEFYPQTTAIVEEEEHIARAAARRRQYDPDGSKARELVAKYHREK